MPLRGILGAARVTCDQHGELRVSWKVENFFSLSAERGDSYNSPIFQFLGRPFCLSLLPRGSSDHESEGWIGLFLRPNQSSPPMEVEFTLGIKTSGGKIEERTNFIHTFQKMGLVFGMTNWLKRSDLLIRRQELAPSDALTFTVSMKMNVPRPVAGTTEVAVQTSPDDVDGDDESRLPEKAGCEKVAEDLGKQWSISDNSDVILKVGDVEFKAHRAILGARAPVFRDMFDYNTEEKESGVVTITDCQPKIFQEFLRHIYARSPPELTAKNVFGLYALADEYMVEDLKAQCLRYMGNSLCVETFCDTVLLALKYLEAELLKQALDFATENLLLIISSVEWPKFQVEHPRKAHKILIKALGPHKDHP